MSRQTRKMRLFAVLVMAVVAIPAVAGADGIDDRAAALYQAMAPSACLPDSISAPSVFEFSYKVPAQPGKPLPLRIYQFACSMGDLIVEHVYVSYSAAEGLQLVAFAQPNYDVRCANGPTNVTIECTRRIDGFGTLLALPNSTIDPATGAITTCLHWLPSPCAAIARVWELQDGRYVLTAAEGLPPLDGGADSRPTE